MRQKKSRINWLVAGLSTITLLLGGIGMKESTANQASPVLFDVIYLQEGRQVSEATAYFDHVASIAKKYGLVRLKTYPVLKNMKGIIPQPALINIWRMDSPDAMQKMGSDPAYQELVPTRDALFDMSKVSLIMAENS